MMIPVKDLELSRTEGTKWDKQTGTAPKYFLCYMQSCRDVIIGSRVKHL